MTVQIQIPQKALLSLGRRHRLQRLALFGSGLRKDFGAGSDIDVLADSEPGHMPGLGFVRLQPELSEPLGRPFDLHAYRRLSRYFRDEVTKETDVQCHHSTQVSWSRSTAD